MISVVVPCLNAAPFIAEAIESVRAQTFRDWELIVADDGSTDGSQEIVRGFAARDDRIRQVQYGFRSVSRVCNAAIELARFPWIARLDADDAMLPQRLEWQMAAAAARPDVVLWGGWAGVIGRTGKRLWPLTTGPVTDAEFERQKGDFITIQACTHTYRRDVFRAIGGYDPRFDTVEDLELLSRMSERGPCLVVPKEMARYRFHGTSLTASKVDRQYRLILHVCERNAARAAGRPEETLEQYQERLRRAPAWRRALARLDTACRQQIRNANLHWAEDRRLRAVACVGGALLANPWTASSRLRVRLARMLRHASPVAANGPAQARPAD